MKIKININIDVNSYGFKEVKQLINPDGELTLKEIKTEIKEELINRLNDQDIEEFFPDWSDLFL